MKYHFFEGEINQENTNKLIDFINENQEDEITIYINSGGGSNFFTNAIINLLNQHKEKIKIIVPGCIYSNAFYIFFNFKGKRELLDEATGMFHYSGKDYHLKENGKIGDYGDIFDLNEFKKRKKITDKFCVDLGFNDKEMRKLGANKDVYFSRERLEEFLKNQTN